MRSIRLTLPLLPLFAVACGGAASPYAASPRYAPSRGDDSVASAEPAAEPEADATEETTPAPMSAPPPPAADYDRSRARGPAATTPSKSTSAPVAAASGVKAGEWDDNANYREFQRWLATEDGEPFHRVDIRDRRFLVVRDAHGKAVPRCKVVVEDEAQHSTSLLTTASGRAILFPHAEGLTGKNLRATASCEGASVAAKLSLDAADGVVDLQLASDRTLPSTRAIDVAFILDTTGSMSEEIAAVKTTIQRVASTLGDDSVRVRVGLVEYKDRGDEYVTKVYPMTSDLAAFEKQVARIQASGGGDTPESVNEGVHVGLTKLAWSDDAVAKFAFLVGDAPPHLDYAQDFDYAVDMKGAAHRGIELFTVAASGMDDLGQIVFRQLAAYTGATNLFVLRGGAGPQSTGAGDPKSSCGGTQKSYASGNLDALIVGKIRGELKGLDGDPLKIPGVGKDEQAKPCVDRVLAPG
jgi:Mg-chelatase subunit ChlD